MALASACAELSFIHHLVARVRMPVSRLAPCVITASAIEQKEGGIWIWIWVWKGLEEDLDLDLELELELESDRDA